METKATASKTRSRRGSAGVRELHSALLSYLLPVTSRVFTLKTRSKYWCVDGWMDGQTEGRKDG